MIADFRSYANDCNFPLNEVLLEVKKIALQAHLTNCFNSPVPFDAVPTRQNVTVGESMYMYDNDDFMVEEEESESIKASQTISDEVPDTVTTLNSLSQLV